MCGVPAHTNHTMQLEKLYTTYCTVHSFYTAVHKLNQIHYVVAENVYYNLFSRSSYEDTLRYL